jgi:hypothetical protein
MSIFGKLFGRLSTGPNRDIAGGVVKSTGWTVREDLLVREYEFWNLPPPATQTYLRIECFLSRYDNGYIATNLRFCLRPYLYLMPDRSPLADHIVDAPFSVSLFASGSGEGTEVSPIFRGGIFDVAAYEDEPETAFLFTDIETSVALWINALSAGVELTFAIVDRETGNIKLRLCLPNDQKFKKLCKNLPAS